MESERHFQRYLEVIQRWATPEEVSALLRKVGSPEAVEDMLADYRADREHREWWKHFRRRCREGLIWFGLVGGAFAAVAAARAVWSSFAG